MSAQIPMKGSGASGSQTQDTSQQSAAFKSSLSLPSGGGAIRGIDEKFTANLATGSASVSVPIAATPGRADFQLGLALGYDSGAGNGPFGLGWQLSAGAISRKTSLGLPTYVDEDTFILQGAEDLVPVGEETRQIGGVGWTVHRYQPRVEGGFARIERFVEDDTGDQHWQVRSGDNTVSIYGQSALAQISDPSDPTRVFSWLLEEVRDPLGHIVRYSYVAEDNVNVPLTASEHDRRELPQAQRYLKRIEYGNSVPHQVGGFLFELVFDYGGHTQDGIDPDQPWPARPDAFSAYRAGFEVRTRRLCRRALMFHRFAELGAGPVLVRSTDFTYAEDPAFSQLTDVTQRAWHVDDNDVLVEDSLPPMSFEYQAPEFVFEQGRLDTADTHGGLPQLIDLDGEALPGLLRVDAQGWRYQHNLGEGRFAAPKLQSPRPSMGLTQLVDVDGDGQLEMVQRAGPVAGVHDRTAEGDWKAFVPFTSQPRIDWSDPDLRLIDLTGDGRADLLITEHTALRWYPSRGAEGFDAAEFTALGTDEKQAPVVLFSDERQSIHLADMSGDGLSDIVRVRPADMCYWPNLGHGRFGARIVIDNPPLFEANFDPQRLRLVDIDGTGTADVIYLGARGAKLYLNQAGNRMADAIVITGLPIMHDQARVEVADLLGNGTACLVWSTGMPATSGAKYVDLLGGKKPHLMTATRNNLGGERRFTYTPSTRWYLEDQAAGRPWVTRLPFVVHTLSGVEQIDHVARTRLTSQYRYAHGYFDGVEREFRGFAYVEQTDTEVIDELQLGEGQSSDADLQQPPVLTKTWMHTGAFENRTELHTQLSDEFFDADAPLEAAILPDGLSWDAQREAFRALRGAPLRQEIYALDDAGAPSPVVPYVITENSYALEQLRAPTPDLPGVFLRTPRSARTRTHEAQADDPRVQHEFVLSTNAYGQPVQTASVVYGRVTPDLNLPPEVRDAQAQVHVQASTVDYTAVIDAVDALRLPVAWQTRAEELGVRPSAARFGHQELVDALAAAAPIGHEVEITPGTNERRLLGLERTRFLDALLQPLPWGQIDPLGLVEQTQTLAYTPALLTELGTIQEADLTAAGYVADGTDWWIPSEQATYGPNPAARFYLPTGAVAPLGMQVQRTLDAYNLLVIEEQVTGEAWTASTVDYDYRTLQPVEVVDPNGTESLAAYDGFGRLLKSAIRGANGEGDTLAAPTAYFEYEVHRWHQLGEPNRARAFARETHADAQTRWRQSVTYSNGSGGVALSKVETQPGPATVLVNGVAQTVQAAQRWLGSGRTLLNNKGNPVRQYEPYFSVDDGYDDAAALREIGSSPTITYDALGRAKRTDMPDGTFTRAEWTAWSSTTYDAGDNVLGSDWYTDRGSPLPAGGEPATSDARAAWLSAQHDDTPAVVHFDSLGRPVYAEANLGGESITTRTEQNLDQSRVRVFDNRSKLEAEDPNTPANPDAGLVSETRIGLAGRPLWTDTAEQGVARAFLNVLDQPVKAWDSHGRAMRTEYDALHRPIAEWISGTGVPEYRHSCTVYGDQHLQAAARNLYGAVCLTLDQGGSDRIQQVDFKGNPQQVERQLCTAYTTHTDWSGLDLTADADAIFAAAQLQLDAEVFSATTSYDAHGQVISTTLPDGSITTPIYAIDGQIERFSVQTPGQAAVEVLQEQIYSAKGQRQSVLYGNGVRTTYTFDDLTLRLASLQTHRQADAAGSNDLQALSYTYDADGRIVEIIDAAQQTQYFNNMVVSADQRFEYDALGRLTKATGRERAGGVNNGGSGYQPPTAFNTVPHANDGNQVRGYTQTYQYDTLGNITQLKHSYNSGGVTGGWTRNYNYAYPGDPTNRTNRLLNTEVSGAFQNLTYDARGNTTSMAHLPMVNPASPPMDWDLLDQLQHVQLPGGGDAWYVYDASGMRTRAVTVTAQGLIKERIYLGGLEIYRERQGAGPVRLERETLRISDAAGSFLQVDTKRIDTGGHDPDNALGVPLFRYSHGNHLGSATLTTDDAGQAVAYEEMRPYGTVAWRAGAPRELSLKRYRFTGKERDVSTGLDYFGARYYAPWLGRWISCDPAGFVDGLNLYRYCRNDPVGHVDPDGRQAVPDIEHPVDHGAAGSGGEPEYVEIQPSLIAAQKRRFNERLDNTLDFLAANPWAYDNSPPAIGSVNGVGVVGSQKSVERQQQQARAARALRTGRNISTSVLGGVGYAVDGDRGSDIGAAASGVVGGLGGKTINSAVGAGGSLRVVPPKRSIGEAAPFRKTHRVKLSRQAKPKASAPEASRKGEASNLEEMIRSDTSPGIVPATSNELPKKGMDVALGLTRDRKGQPLLEPFAKKIGAVSNERWIQVGLADRVAFVLRFHQALYRSISTGGRAKFNLDYLDLNPALRTPRYSDPFNVGVTNWELQQILHSRYFYGKTDFYIGDHKLSPGEMKDLGLRFRGESR